MINITNMSYNINFTTDLQCSYVDNINYCTGQIAVVPIHQDIIVVLLLISTACLFILAIKALSEVILK